MSAEARPRACGECLRRAWLVGSLAGHIDKAVDRTAGNRARELLALSNEELARAMAGSKAGSFLRRARERDPVRMLGAVSGSGAWACCRHDQLYPEALHDLGDAPAVLFGRGRAAILRELSRDGTVTIVGSRRPSRYGRELATELGAEIAAAGFAVVSGMALGIDSAAQTGALRAAGLTIAVLGCGVDLTYPPRCARLYAEIIERGLVIGELPPGTGPRRWTFPARNRIMAALGGMTVVVEARERSGSLITAEMAEDLNRDVGAVPGLVGSSPAAGTNGLIREGAHLIRGAQDVLDALIGPGAPRRSLPTVSGPHLDPELADLLDLVERGSGTADALARVSRLQPGPLATALVRLELSGYVRCNAEGRYERTSLALPVTA
ncbi:MAG TPA: DNA-processing protein DprA [Solirubrobacterales bacterium]